MLDAISEKIKTAFRSDLYAGLMGMFAILHFYYAVPVRGWIEALLGLAAVVVAVFVMSIVSFFVGNGLRSTFALTLLALSLDFFYRGHFPESPKHLLFEYLWNGPAAINFASLGLATAWLFAQLEPNR